MNLFLVCFLLLCYIPCSKKIWGGKGLFDSCFPGHSQSLRELWSEVKVAVEADIIEELCLLACALVHAQLAFLHSPDPPARG